MVYYLLREYPNVMMACGFGAVAAYFFTIFGLKVGKDKLPADEGREFAVDGKLSKGKPRGAGIHFIMSFIISTLLFCPMTVETGGYLAMIFVEMMTGFLDDASDKPWGRWKKGLLDFVVAGMVAFLYLFYNGNAFMIGFLEKIVVIPYWLFAVLIIAMVWVSINVTNCADGIDGLSGTLTLITIMSFLMADNTTGYLGHFRYVMVFFMASVLGYLWFNAAPSILMMGDAGSRAMGIFIAIVALKSGMPLLFIPFAGMLIVDGGIGLVKVTLIKVFKVNPLKNIRTPLHDHVRKQISVTWSNSQCVMRFAIIQSITSIIVIYLLIK